MAMETERRNSYSATSKSDSSSIIDIVSQIEDKNMILPEFQRDFIWTTEKTLDLFDSLVKRIHIGSLIYGRPQFEISYRDFDTSDRKANKRSKKYREEEKKRSHVLTAEMIREKRDAGKASYKLVLDGQQRLTSIYRAVIGKDDVWFVTKDDENLIKNSPTNKTSLEDLLWKFSETEDKNRLCIKISDVYLNDHSRESVKKTLFESSQFAKSLNEQACEEYFNAYVYLFELIQALLASENLVSYFLLDMSLEKFVLFFERSNSKGMALDFIDILVAKVYKGFNLREHIKDFNNEHEYDIIPDIPVRAISYLVSNGHDIDKNYILQNLTAGDFNKYWEGICLSYENAVNYLRENKYINDLKELPYANLLLTLTLVAYNTPDKSLDSLNENQTNFIDWWYWSVAFSKHYTSASNEATMLDIEALNMIINGQKNNAKVERFLKELTPLISTTDYHDIIDLKASRNPIHSGINGLIRRHNFGVVNWINNKVLANTVVDSHHIFPQKYLSSLGFKDDIIDCLSNRVIISKITNIKIGKKSPSEYIKEIKKDNANVVETIEKCFIPNVDKLMSGYYDDKYEEFLDARSKVLFNLLFKEVFSKTEWANKYAEKRIIK